MKKLIIGGVPEHFNLPWHLAIEEGLFEKAGIKAEWKDYAGGTGAMAKDLRENTLDVALLLTEGAVADIIKGGNYKIAGLYVESPLIWGVHVHAETPFRQMAELDGKTFAISRFGSGSHLMAFVNAQQQGWNPSKLQFEVVGKLEGAREALASHKADAFMWEKFMTKPLVDKGEWRRIGECPTPWPCFVIVVRDEIAATHQETIQQLLKISRISCEQLKERTNAVSLIAQYYHLAEDDVAIWLNKVQWANDNTLKRSVLTNVVETLFELGIIEKKLEPEALCNNFCKLI